MTQENQHEEPTKEAGGYGTPTAEQEMPRGGTEEQVSAENASTDPGFDADAKANAQAAMPSSEADMDAANTEEPNAGRSFSSESGQDAAGLPDGSGTDLPESKSPKDRDDDEEQFDAG
jgi:hypothetical protein